LNAAMQVSVAIGCDQDLSYMVVLLFRVREGNQRPVKHVNSSLY
jgi:hypothetical protein